MYKPKNKAMSPWMSGFSLLGLLVVVAIMVYLFKMQAEVSIPTYNYSKRSIDDIQDKILGRPAEALKEAEEEYKELPPAAPAEKPAPTTRPAPQSPRGSMKTVTPGTPLGPISPVTPVAPMAAPTGGLQPTTAKTPAKKTKSLLDARSKALEKMIEDY